MSQVSPDQLYHQSFTLMCLAEGIKPVGDSDVTMDEKLAALATPDGFSSLVMQAGGIRIELDPQNHQENAERIMQLLDVLDGYTELFWIDIQDTAATLLPTETQA